MSLRDGKDRFYRTLNLDKESRETLKEFNKIKKKMLNEIKNKKPKEDQKYTKNY